MLAGPHRRQGNLRAGPNTALRPVRVERRRDESRRYMTGRHECRPYFGAAYVRP